MLHLDLYAFLEKRRSDFFGHGRDVRYTMPSAPRYRSSIRVICEEVGSGKADVVVPTDRMLQLIGKLADIVTDASQPPETIPKNQKFFEPV